MSIYSVYIIVAVTLVLYFVLFRIFKPVKLSVKSLTYCGICISISFVLSLIKLFQLPQGGSIALCSMLFITITGYMYGTYCGIISGIVLGLLKLIADPFVIHPIQLILDYQLAYASLGLSGLFKGKNNGLILGYITGVSFRFIFAFISGTIFFKEYIPTGQNQYLYSLAYNASYILPEVILTILIISIPGVKTTINSIIAKS